jgi:hypothetical protein
VNKIEDLLVQCLIRLAIFLEPDRPVSQQLSGDSLSAKTTHAQAWESGWPIRHANLRVQLSAMPGPVDALWNKRLPRESTHLSQVANLRNPGEI